VNGEFYVVNINQKLKFPHYFEDPKKSPQAAVAISTYR
jgi:hypothetical protein